MYIALYLFLGLTMIGDVISMLSAGTDRNASDGLRLIGIFWHLVCLVWATVLIVLLANR